MLKMWPHVCDDKYKIRHLSCNMIGCKYQSNLGKENWQAVKCILKYLQGIKNMILYFEINDIELIGYNDVDFESD